MKTDVLRLAEQNPRVNRSRLPHFHLLKTSWLGLFLAAITAACLSPAGALAAPASIEGEYQCDDCHGYLRIQKQRSGAYKVWLGVGGGSCGGEVLVDRSVRYSGGPLTIAHTLNSKRCTATVDFSDGGATVSDSCLGPDDEKSSTCALLGPYTRQGR